MSNATRKEDPLAKALDEAQPTASVTNKVEHLFGDRPQVIESIIKARSVRKLSYSQIARLLSSDGVSIRSEAVKTFLTKKGVR